MADNKVKEIASTLRDITRPIEDYLSELWDLAYDEGKDAGFADGYDKGYIAGKEEEQ